MREFSTHKAVTESGWRSPGPIVALTSLRGYLALWVVLFHYRHDVVRLCPSTMVLLPLMQWGHMAVPAFFMLSGFVLAYNYADRFPRLGRPEVIRFLCLRLARIYPVHLFTLLVVAAMVWVSGRVGYPLTDMPYTARNFVLNLFLVQTWTPNFTMDWNYPSWSISSEWFAYLIFPLAVIGILRHLTTPLRATFAGGTALASAIAVMVWGPWPLYELVLVVPTFLAGATIYWILRGRLTTEDSRLWRWLPEALVLLVGASCFLFLPAFTVASLLCCFLGLILVLAWLGPYCHLPWSARPAVFLGDISYSLYLTHMLAYKWSSDLCPLLASNRQDC